MPICCSLVGPGKHYLLAEVGRLLNSVIFGFLRKKQNKKPLLCFISHFNLIFFLRQDLSFYLCFRQTISLHGPTLLSEHCCCKCNLKRKTKIKINDLALKGEKKKKNCLSFLFFSFLFFLSLSLSFFLFCFLSFFH